MANSIPRDALAALASDRAFVFVTQREPGSVFATCHRDPATALPCPSLRALADVVAEEGVHDVFVTVRRLGPGLIDEALNSLPDDGSVRGELASLASREPGAMVAYVVTHFNAGPAFPATVFIGGDCYRSGPDIKDFDSILRRTRHLATAMVRKSVMIFPRVPALHGGKKGEWIVVRADGTKIESVSEPAIVALGSVVLADGIRFIDAWKEGIARERGLFETFPARGAVTPDTLSPDVVSGPNWGTLCHAWVGRGVETRFMTCLPNDLGGPDESSSKPTALGTTAVAADLYRRKFPGKPMAEGRFLVEALGGVGKFAVRDLLDRGVRPNRVTAFDPNPTAVDEARTLGIDARRAVHDEFYAKLPSEPGYDVWINNGVGDNTTPEHVARLLAAGVKVFCGAANNLLEVDTLDRSLEAIWAAGAWVWPDEATSAGGYTLAAIDCMTRCQGRASSGGETMGRIIDTIVVGNENLIAAVFETCQDDGPETSGRDLWSGVGQVIDARVKDALETELDNDAIRAAMDVTTWDLGTPVAAR